MYHVVQDRERRQQTSCEGAGGRACDAAHGNFTDTADVPGGGVNVCKRGDGSVGKRPAIGVDIELCGWGGLRPCGDGQLFEAEAGTEEGGTDSGSCMSSGRVLTAGVGTSHISRRGCRFTMTVLWFCCGRNRQCAHICTQVAYEQPTFEQPRSQSSTR